ncbi:MAG: glycosyltransferase family 39 protein [Victivallaceae bacterium]
MNPKIEQFITRNFPVFIFFFSAFCSTYLLYSARAQGLLPHPVEGTDQLSMLHAAASMYSGDLPPAGYMYSPVYTVFLFILFVLSKGNLIVMRLLQALLCALIPVMIYKLSLRLRLGRPAAQLSAIMYCFYGPALLISLDFLRAAPLALCFITMVYFLVSGFNMRCARCYVMAGLFAGLCVLGRENFLPVIASPIVLLLFRDIRKHVSLKFASAYSLAAAAVIFAVMFYNLANYSSFSIVPGHVVNVLEAYHGNAAVADSGFALQSIVKNIPVQIYNFVAAYEIPNSLSYYAHRDVIDFFKIFIIPFNLLVALGVVALAFRIRHRGLLLLWLLIGAYGCSMVFFNMFYRFRIPVVPLLAILAGAGLVALWNVFIQKKYLALAAGSLFIVVIFFFTWRDSDKLRPESERTTVAVFLVKSKHFALAEDYINRMRQDGIKTEKLEKFLISSLHKDGDAERARELYEKWFVPVVGPRVPAQ